MSTAVANALGLKLVWEGQGQYSYTNKLLDQLAVQAIVDNGTITWQVPGQPDCGNDDGMLYVVVPGGLGEDDREIEVAIDPETNMIFI